MTFKINGLDDFSNRLDQLSENAQSVAGTHEYSFKEVFSDQFMIEHTNFSTIDEFLLSSPEKISNAEEFEKADLPVSCHACPCRRHNALSERSFGSCQRREP